MSSATPPLLGVILASALLAGCAEHRRLAAPERSPVSESRILSLYGRLTIGMTKDEVEAIVGRPLGQPLRQAGGEEDYHYVDKPERQLEPHESPWSFGGLVITYKDGRLVDKKYNPQWVRREHREPYEKRSL